MVKRRLRLLGDSTENYDMSDDDGVFQDAPEEWSKKPEKPRPRYQRHTSNVEILEDMTPSPLDAETFLIPGALPECSVDTFQEPLRIIEEEGIEKYLDWLASSTMTKHSTVQTHQERQLADATIAGDPREYQRLLLESALAQNTIVHLGTGYGKTLIALLLIKEKSIEWKNDKQAVFLVPSVALAIQQALSLRANLPFTVETACYDASNSEIHRHKLQKAQIIVATHGALLDLLMHYGDLFSMRRFNVVVMDECHYCAGNHAYAIIMNKFYHTIPKEERPHVLGLTASPLVSVRDSHSDQELESMLHTLEETLDAKLVSSEHLIPDIFRKRVAIEAVIEYEGSQRSLPPADNLPLHSSRFREFRQLQQLYQDLGPLPVSLYCKVLVRELARNEFENETPQEYGAAIQHLKSMIRFCEQECHCFSHQGRTDKLVALEEVLEAEIEHHGGSETVGLVFADRRVTAVALHNYFQWREQNREKEKIKYSWGRSAQLRRGPSLSTRIIPPVHSRDNDTDDIFADSGDDPFLKFQAESVPESTGLSIKDQFMDADHEPLEVNTSSQPQDPDDLLPRRRTSIRSIALVRNVTNIFNSLSMKRTPTDTSKASVNAWLHVNHKIRDVLTKLRRKELNLLFATSVVEEGVDVQACSVVVVFDSIRTTKSYVQMKGRARKQNAKFFVLEDRLDKANKAVLSLVSAQDMERRLQEFIEQKTKRNSLDLERMDASCEDMSSEPELDALRQGYFKSENAIVDLQSAKSLLNRYSISVPLDPFVRCSRETLLAHMPEYRENILILPSHLPGRIRRVILPEEFWNRPIGEKWKLLSLAACVRLHAHGLLNHRLLPLNRSDMHNKIRRATTNRFVDVKPIPLPLETFFCDHGTQQIFIHTIRHESESYLRCERILQGQGHYLGLITFEPLTNIILPISIFHKEFGIVTTSLGPSSEERCNNEQMNRLREVFLLLMNERWRRQSRNMYFRFRKQIEYKSAFMPYLVGILSQEGRLDWDLMSDLLLESKRTRDERKTAMASLSITEKLPKPRLWISIKDNHTSYIAYGPANQKASADFPAQKEGVKTYQDYFEKYREIIIPLNDQLFDTQRYWTQPSTFLTVSPSDSQEIPTIKTSGVKYEMCPELSAIKVPHSACMEATIANAHIGLLTCFLPQVLFAFERYVNSNAFIKFCDANLPLLGSYLGRLPIESVATAMTAKSCGLHVSYEKLEWLGDAVLKMIQTESLLKSVELREWIQFLHEGDLSILRQEMGCNKKLVQVCHHFGFEKYILSSSLARGKWLPSCLDFTDDTYIPSTTDSRQKIFADIIESLLGLIYLEFGYPAAMEVGNELTVTVSWEEPALEESSGRANVDSSLLDCVQRATGYTGFRRPELLEEAFSHPTAGNPEVSSYERLEWIGDAVLCLATREWIWNNFHHLELSDMVTMESALVSNEVLSFLCIQTGLHRFLEHKDHTLPPRIESYICSIQDDGSGLWGTDPPKAIADVVESLFGAIYTDSGLSQGMTAVSNMLGPMYNALLQFERENKEIRLTHPKKALQEMVGEVLSLDTSFENDFARQQSSTVVLDGKVWRMADPLSSNVVGSIHLMECTLVAVSNFSATVARNQACALIVQALQRNPGILQRLKDFRQRVEFILASKAHTIRKSNDDDDDDDNMNLVVASL